MNGDIRLWFSKTGGLKYIAHLDFSRYLSRVLKMTGLPFWYTQGFNPRIYLAFAIPLSLGMTGLCECADVRLTEETSREEILSKMNENLAHGLVFYDVTERKKKLGEIGFARYRAQYTPCGRTPEELYEKISELRSLEFIEIEKKSKSGMKTVDIAEEFHKVKFSVSEDCVLADMILPQSSVTKSVSPKLIIEAISQYTGYEIDESIERAGLYDLNGEIFK